MYKDAHPARSVSKKTKKTRLTIAAAPEATAVENEVPAYAISSHDESPPFPLAE